MNDLDDASPEEHRARYEALRSRAAARRSLTTAGDPASVSDRDIVWRERLPAGAYAAVRVPLGRRLRLVDTDGTSSVSWLAWHADDTSERYNAGDTIKVQWTARLSTGRLLLSDMGRVLASITADTAGGHDPLVGGSTRATVRRGGRPGARNARDNLVLAASKFGLGVADVPTPIAFFADLRTDEAGRFVWAGVTEPGRLVELRAEVDLLVALSNTAHPFDPSGTPGPVEAIVWRAPPAETGGPAGGSEEVQRAFENTRRAVVGR